MVGQRQWSVLGTSSKTIDDQDSRRNSNSKPLRQSYYGSTSGSNDNILAAEGEKRRRELKNKILEGVKDFNVEQYRKSEEELKSIKNKRVRAFYEAQNRKLNDWAEVDSLVWSLADDVVDSIDPDANRDGIVDRNTPLLHTGYDLEAFLPLEERERRIKNYRIAQRALNVSHPVDIFFCQQLSMILDQCPGKFFAPVSESGGYDIDTVSVFDCFTHRFGIGPIMYNDYLVNK
jgi:hypothetical protein